MRNDLYLGGDLLSVGWHTDLKKKQKHYVAA